MSNPNLIYLRTLFSQQQYGALILACEMDLENQFDLATEALRILALLHTGERSIAMDSLGRLEDSFDQMDQDTLSDLAAIYIVLFRLERATELLESILQIDSEHALALARLAWCRMQQGGLEEALALYRQSAALAPHRLPVWSALVRLSLESEDLPAAQQALDSAIAVLDETQEALLESAVQSFVAQFRGLQLEIWVAADELAQAEQWLESRRESIDQDTWIALILNYSALLAGRDLHAEAETTLRDSLTHYPDNLALISQLVELAQLQGRTMQAVQLLRRSIAQAQQQGQPEVDYWIRLSGVCLHTQESQARKAAEKAMELVEALHVGESLSQAALNGLSLRAKNALAQVENQQQQFETAETLYNEILAENPYFVPALQGLGHQQMLRGNIDAAIALFERIKQIDPAKGVASLINARQFPEEEETLLQMEKMAYQPSLEGEVRSGILFQLASAWEKRKEYDKAMALANTANAGSRKLLHYDPKDHRQRCARIRYAFPKALYEHRKACGYCGDNESLPVFVLGMPRSGTTLVEQIIASHSKIFGAGELGVIPQRIAGLNRWERHVGSGRTYPDCIDDLSPSVVEGIAKGILDELKELAAQDKPDAHYIVDKLPHNFENIGLIKFLFPHAKIISVRRDPRDVALSNYFTDYQAKHGGMGFAYDLEWIGQQLSDHNLLMHHWNQLFPGDILEVSYEDVVENTEFQARRMLKYIGVDFESQVLAFNELDRPVKTASVWQVRQPIYKTSKAKWMRYQNHMADLIKGTNAKIEWDAITDMISLPEP
uniref:tetratricopeptide repeat-containing sulfotransferase family protein n=1 Tax=Amphritea sp. TaxID=1872502 RepID=UPI00356893D6